MKRLLLTGLAVAAFVGGQPVFKPRHEPVEPPPRRFATGPFPVQPTYIFVDYPNAKCQSLAPIREKYQACSIPTKGIIYMPHDDGSPWWQSLKMHEEAHLRGWRHR